MGGTFYSAFAATGRLRIACISSSFQWLTERLRRIRSFDMVEKGWTLSTKLKKLPVVAGLCVLLLVSLLAIRTFQRRLVRAPTNASAPTGKFWRTVTWEQNDSPGFFQVDALGQIRKRRTRTSGSVCRWEEPSFGYGPATGATTALPGWRMPPTWTLAGSLANEVGPRVASSSAGTSHD